MAFTVRDLLISGVFRAGGADEIKKYTLPTDGTDPANPKISEIWAPREGGGARQICCNLEYRTGVRMKILPDKVSAG